MTRPGLGLAALVAGAALLGLALALPWISIPGGDISRELMRMRGEAIPATGAAWTSLPLTSAALGLLALAALAATALGATAHRLRPFAAVVTAGGSLIVLFMVIARLFADRPAGEYTAVGAGGYLGVLGILLIVLGAVIVLREARAGSPSLAWREPRQPASLPRQSAPADLPPGVPRLGARAAVGAAALVAVYVATRVSFADRLPYFLDEGTWAAYADQAAGSRSKLFVALEFGQGPFMTWLSAAWVKLGFAPLTAVRLVSVTAGLLTVVVVALLARSLAASNAAAWVAAVLCTVLPFFLVHDGLGIYEPLVTLIMAGALALQIAFARRPDLRVAGLLGAVLAAGVLTKQNALPAVLLLPASLLCFDWSEPDRRGRLKTWLLGICIVAVMVVAADLLQRSSSYWEAREAATKDFLLWPVRSVTDVLNHPFGVFEQNWDAYRPALLGYVTAPLLVTTVLGAVVGLRRQPRQTLLLLAWILVPFIIGMLFQLRPYPRHAMFLVPPAIALSSYAIVIGAGFLRQRLPQRTAFAACAACAALLLTPALVLDARVLAHPSTARYPGLDYWQYVAGWPAGRPWPGAADIIRSRARSRRVVIVTPGGSFSVLDQLLGGDSRFEFVPAGSPLASRAQFALFDTSGFPVEPKGFEAQMARMGFVQAGRFTRPSGPCSGPRQEKCGSSVVVFQRDG